MCESRQAQKATYYMIPCVGNVQKVDSWLLRASGVVRGMTAKGYEVSLGVMKISWNEIIEMFA